MSTLLIDLKGQTLTQEEVELLAHPLVAGLILFTRNFYDREQIQALVKSVRQRVKKPLLITVDQEPKRTASCRTASGLVDGSRNDGPGYRFEFRPGVGSRA